MTAEHWVNVAISAIGMVGALAAGAIGYQSGSNAVNKDYVSLAISTLDKKDASPELRKWSVDVLSKLSPVPFNNRLKEELTENGIQRKWYIYIPVSVPKFATELCPDILPHMPRDIGNNDLKKLIKEYEICRAKYAAFYGYVQSHNKIVNDQNEKERKIENNFRRSVGLPAEPPISAGE